ncbi:39S ribosomal protein L38, mitochondrial isoform X2 [Scyliorhinus canicula]|uniref:39S ribosomal protein L38, mitochondrial isoform X2 n=1 Tax=Scyliorhinus canicula TaxID=7830 RepID=UPI0018F661D5|nr:39S ribosomal protein L38, mitochondrial isoform X2 [Scyliorhinus canicula]
MCGLKMPYTTGVKLSASAVLCKRTAPLGPMPNEEINVAELESIEKYRSYARYLHLAEEKSKQPTWWRTYKQYTQEPAPEKIDIGLPHFRESRKRQLKERRRIATENHKNSDLERAARHRTLSIPLDEVKAEWEKTNGPLHLRKIGEHYGVYRDLFNSATFVPRVMLRIQYGHEDDAMPVYHGNVVTPSEALNLPRVSFEAEEGSLWTLLLTNPDGHLRDNESEYVHWLVGNIPGNAVSEGEDICHYFPPFPAKGTGYHRCIFIIFKQDELIDFKEDFRPSPCHSLNFRTFKTFDFYKKHQDLMTPAGLAFFQCRWDESVTHIFHNLLDMKEPVFEYDFPPVYHPPQKKYPHGQPLRYLDRYRDSHEPTYGIY